MFGHTAKAASWTAIALTGVALAGCATTRPSATATAQTGGETAAMAATFRHLFANNGSSIKTGAASYCIGTGTGATLSNPSPELIETLADVRPRVVPVSACQRDVRAVDASGRPVLIFNLTTVECDGLDNCVFEGGYYEGNLSASGGRYRAHWIDGKWQVAPEGPQAIS